MAYQDSFLEAKQLASTELLAIIARQEWPDGTPRPGGGSGAFATDSNVTSNSPGTLGTDDFVFGSDSLDDDGNSTHDDRIIFDKSKGAFRAGGTPGTEWDDASRGFHSTGLGLSCTASGAYSLAAGISSQATGDRSIAIGDTALASAVASTAISRNAEASGIDSIAFGRDCTASGVYSLATGAFSVASLLGEHAHAAGSFSADGDAQIRTFVLRADTTDATSEEMYINNNSGGGKLIVPADTVWDFRVEVVARITSVNNQGNGARYSFYGGIKNVGGTTSIVASTVSQETVREDTGLVGASVSVAANDTDDTLAVNITGIAATDINWVAKVEVVQVQ